MREIPKNIRIIPTRQIKSQSKQFCIGDLTPFDLIWSQMSVSHRVPNFLLSKIYHGVIATALVVCLQAGVLSFFTAILPRYAQKSKNVIPWENTSEIERYRCWLFLLEGVIFYHNFNIEREDAILLKRIQTTNSYFLDCAVFLYPASYQIPDGFLIYFRKP